MNQLYKTAAVGMLLVLLGVPATACLLPHALLTAEEKACCRAMANQCGEMDMPPSHSCCQKTVQHHDVAVMKDASHIWSPQSSAQAAHSQSPLLAAESVAHSSAPERLRHPPPSSLSPTIEILRI